jgi:hypothetical protein
MQEVGQCRSDCRGVRGDYLINPPRSPFFKGGGECSQRREAHLYSFPRSAWECRWNRSCGSGRRASLSWFPFMPLGTQSAGTRRNLFQSLFFKGGGESSPLLFQRTALAFTLTISGLIYLKQIQCQQYGISRFFWPAANDFIETLEFVGFATIPFAASRSLYFLGQSESALSEAGDALKRRSKPDRDGLA